MKSENDDNSKPVAGKSTHIWGIHLDSPAEKVNTFSSPVIVSRSHESPHLFRSFSNAKMAVLRPILKIAS